MMNLSLQRMPFPPTAYNRFLSILGFVLGLLVVISFLYTAATITKVTKFICTNSFSLKLSSSLKFSFIEQLLGVHGGLVGRLILSRSISIMSCATFMYVYCTYVLYICVYNVQELVLEKDSRIRESMLMMGLRQWVLWASWFIKQLLFMLIWVIAYTIFFKVIILEAWEFRLTKFYIHMHSF